jgi:hypothetical protein
MLALVASPKMRSANSRRRQTFKRSPLRICGLHASSGGTQGFDVRESSWCGIFGKIHYALHVRHSWKAVPCHKLASLCLNHACQTHAGIRIDILSILFILSNATPARFDSAGCMRAEWERRVLMSENHHGAGIFSKIHYAMHVRHSWKTVPRYGLASLCRNPASRTQGGIQIFLCRLRARPPLRIAVTLQTGLRVSALKNLTRLPDRALHPLRKRISNKP